MCEYVIMKTMCPPGYHHHGFVANPCTWAHDNWEGTFFRDNILHSSCFCEIWPLCVLWITYDHLYVCIYIWTLCLKNHNGSYFISLISFALFARSFEDGQNHLLPPVSSLGSRNLRLIQTQRKLKGGWSYQVFVLLCSKKGKHCKWLCLEHLWNDIALLLRYVFQLINHKL